MNAEEDDELINLYCLHIGNKQPVEVPCGPACLPHIRNVHEELYRANVLSFPPAPRALACAEHHCVIVAPDDPSAMQCARDYVRDNDFTFSSELCNRECRMFSIPLLLYNMVPSKWMPPWSPVFVCKLHQVIHACRPSRGCQTDHNMCNMCSTKQGACYRVCLEVKTPDHRERYCLFSRHMALHISNGVGDNPYAFATRSSVRRYHSKKLMKTDVFDTLYNWIEHAFNRYESKHAFQWSKAQLFEMLYADIVSPQHFTYSDDTNTLIFHPRDFWSLLRCIPAPPPSLRLGPVARPNQQLLIPLCSHRPQFANVDMYDVQPDQFDFDFSNPNNPLLQAERHYEQAAIDEKTLHRNNENFIDCIQYIYSTINRKPNAVAAQCSLFRLVETFQHDMDHVSDNNVPYRPTDYFRKVCRVLIYFPYARMDQHRDAGTNVLFECLDDYEVYYLLEHYPSFFTMF